MSARGFTSGTLERDIVMNALGPFRMLDEDVEALRRAKDTLENPGLAARIANLVGLPIEGAMRRLPQKWSAVIHRVTEKALMLELPPHGHWQYQIVTSRSRANCIISRYCLSSKDRS